MAAANMLGLVPYLNRKPKQLSGGQRQRVAVGRAIVRNPIVYLLDEPLSNLDAKLRASMRKELATLHHRLNATFIYVTHDQIEALTLADRIVIMNNGRVQQIASPKDMFDKPENIFVAGFIGTPPMNFYHGYLTTDLRFVQFNARLNTKLTNDVFNKLEEQGLVGKVVEATIDTFNDVIVGDTQIAIRGLSELYGNEETKIKVFVTTNGYLGEVCEGSLKPVSKQLDELKPYALKEVVMASRPDYVYMDEASLTEFKDAVITLDLDYQEHLGAYNLIYGLINGERGIAKVESRDEAKDDKFQIASDMKRIQFFDVDTTSRITDRN
jgi:ABC-type sugar transport system ATPase subunit